MDYHSDAIAQWNMLAMAMAAATEPGQLSADQLEVFVRQQTGVTDSDDCPLCYGPGFSDR